MPCSAAFAFPAATAAACDLRVAGFPRAPSAGAGGSVAEGGLRRVASAGPRRRLRAAGPRLAGRAELVGDVAGEPRGPLRRHRVERVARHARALLELVRVGLGEPLELLARHLHSQGPAALDELV